MASGTCTGSGAGSHGLSGDAAWRKLGSCARAWLPPS
jgi:hypothetical protein